MKDLWIIALSAGLAVCHRDSLSDCGNGTWQASGSHFSEKSVGSSRMTDKL